jgi:hypothetical protein
MDRKKKLVGEVIQIPRHVSICYDRKEMKTADTHLFFLLLAEKLRSLFHGLADSVASGKFKADMEVKRRLFRLYSEFKEAASEYEKILSEKKPDKQEVERLRTLKFEKTVEVWKYINLRFNLAVVRTEILRDFFTTFRKSAPAPQMFLAGVENIRAVIPAIINGSYVPSVAVSPYKFYFKLNGNLEREITLETFKDEWLEVEDFKLNPERFSFLDGKILRKNKQMTIYPFTVDANFAAVASIVKENTLANLNIAVYKEIPEEVGRIFYLMLVTRQAAGKNEVEMSEIESAFKDKFSRVMRKIENAVKFLQDAGILLDFVWGEDVCFFRLKKEGDRGENPLTLSLIKNRLKL